MALNIFTVPKPPPATDSQMGSPVDNIKHYSIETNKPIGCTPLVSGYDVSVVPPRPITCKLVEFVNTNAFLEDEGRLYYSLLNDPHPNMPNIEACLRASDGPRRSYVIFKNYYGDLQSFMRNLEKEDGVLEESKLQSFFSQLVDAVEYCHTHHISLRDMKLGKIMFSNEQQTKLVIADLSNAQLLHPDVRFVYDQRGSPAYVAPEVLTRRPCDPYKTDIWSLGIILYVLATKSYPFRDIHPAKLFQKITSEPLDIPASVPAEAKELLLQMLNRNPVFRPTIQNIKQMPWVVRGAAFAANPAADTVLQIDLTDLPDLLGPYPLPIADLQLPKKRKRNVSVEKPLKASVKKIPAKPKNVVDADVIEGFTFYSSVKKI